MRCPTELQTLGASSEKSFRAVRPKETRRRHLITRGSKWQGLSGRRNGHVEKISLGHEHLPAQ